MNHDTDLSLDLTLAGADANEKLLTDLQTWVNASGISGVRANQKEAPPEKGQMGALTTGLAIVLGSKAVVELVKRIGDWSRDRKPRLTLRIKGKRGKRVLDITLDAENLSDFPQALEKAKSIAATV